MAIKKYTAKANDWELFLIIECESREQAEAIELHIKRMKSKNYIENLKEYFEMRSHLLAKYKL